MSSQQTNMSDEPPPSYDSILNQQRPQDTVQSGAGNGGVANTSAGAGLGSTGSSSNNNSNNNDTANSHSTGVDAEGNRRPRRGDSSHEELDVEEEDRPMPPGWVVQFSEEHDRFFFVDTMNPNGPRSIWTHPLDDPEFLSTVPQGMDPLAYVHKLWADQPMPSPQPGPSSLPQTGGGGRAGSSTTSATNTATSQLPSHGGIGIPSRAGYRQGGTIGMQQSYPGTSVLQGGQRTKVTMEDLTQYYLGKMGTPEEYERRNPRGKFSKLIHEKESPAQRQRRHAEHKARDLADALAYRAPVYRPGPYGYPGYGRYGGGMYAPMGLSAGLLGLGAGAMLGTAMF